MKHGLSFALAGLFTLLLTTACSDTDQIQDPPAIIAQGFDIDEPQTGPSSNFPHIRLRVETQNGIRSLIIHERSFEIDLAKSADASQVALFGISRRVLNKREVTLNFEGFINERLSSPGVYTFDLSVTDVDGANATSHLNIEVLSVDPAPALEEPGTEPPTEQTPDPMTGVVNETLLQSQPLTLRRVGAGDAVNGGMIGITWLTVKVEGVVISLTPQHPDNSKLVSITVADYQRLRTSSELKALIDSESAQQHVRVATAHNGAANSAFGLRKVNQYTAFNILASDTQLSHAGTTVTLRGERKTFTIDGTEGKETQIPDRSLVTLKTSKKEGLWLSI